MPKIKITKDGPIIINLSSVSDALRKAFKDHKLTFEKSIQRMRNVNKRYEKEFMKKKPKKNWEMFCEHANENPNVCPCPLECGCRQTKMCKDKPYRLKMRIPERFTTGIVNDWATKAAQKIVENRRASVARIAAIISYYAQPLVEQVNKNRKEHASWCEWVDGESCICSAGEWNKQIDIVIGGRK